jgi:hypothetical protein
VRKRESEKWEGTRREEKWEGTRRDRRQLVKAQSLVTLVLHGATNSKRRRRRRRRRRRVTGRVISLHSP